MKKNADSMVKGRPFAWDRQRDVVLMLAPDVPDRLVFTHIPPITLGAPKYDQTQHGSTMVLRERLP